MDGDKRLEEGEKVSPNTKKAPELNRIRWDSGVNILEAKFESNGENLK